MEKQNFSLDSLISLLPDKIKVNKEYYTLHIYCTSGIGYKTWIASYKTLKTKKPLYTSYGKTLFDAIYGLVCWSRNTKFIKIFYSPILTIVD